MAQRPVFVPLTNGFQLVREHLVEFHWYPGFAPSQKMKSVAALHEAANILGLSPLLEISTKSQDLLGRRLSAFNLQIETSGGKKMLLESAFQGSKVFKHGGPYEDLYAKSGKEAKKDARLKTSGRLQSFRFNGITWYLKPTTAFYDWLYLHAVQASPDLGMGLARYCGFTDIEFNPTKSINCQARSCALYVSLVRRGLIGKVLENRRFFLNILAQGRGAPS